MGRPKGSKNKIDHGVYLNCPVCGNPFRVKPSHITLRETCGRKCQAIRFNKYSGKDYKRITVGRKGPREHSILAEQALGRPLPPNAVVHHFDGGKNGGQLVICQDRAYHALLHVRQRAYEATGNPDKRHCANCKEFDDIFNLISHPSNPQRFIHRNCNYKYTSLAREKNNDDTSVRAS